MAELTLGAIGLVGVVDVCWKWGKKLLETCDAFRRADAQLDEHICRLEARWLRVEGQLQMLSKMDPLIDRHHRAVQQRSLEIVLAKVKAAVAKLEALIETQGPGAKPELKKLKYAIFKDGVADIISDIEQWQQIFDPSWFLMLRIADPQVDTLLAAAASASTKQGLSPSTSSLPAAKSMRRAIKSSTAGTSGSKKTVTYMFLDGLVPGSIRPIPFSTASTAVRGDKRLTVVLDPVTCASRTSLNAMNRDIRNFALSLNGANPLLFGLLDCKGILREQADAEAATGSRAIPTTVKLPAFLFRLPESHSHLESLRGRLLDGAHRAHHSLSERFALARQMATAVCYVHLYGFVHKNIRPETILLCHPSRNVEGLAGEIVTLVGFDVLRDAEGKTSRIGDNDWEKNLYRHPQRQGLSLQFDYEMRHDIYSLGVCLLEIGLWESFVDYGANSSVPVLGRGLAVSGGDMSGPDLLKDPEWAKDYLLSLARGPPLRRQMGTVYGRVVETCLTCLDKDNVDFGDEKEFQDEDGVAVDVRYIEKVLMKLGEITA